MTAADIRIVLVRPREDKNIGSVCRAMKTMGFGNLCIVGHQNIDHEAAATTAVHAVDVLDKALHCDSLEQAVEDSVLVAGFTRRRGRWRKYFAITPEQLVERLVSIETGPCSLVFGNEASGLDAKDLSRCHLAVRIPSSPRFPSLNLSHSVQIVTYQIFRRFQEKRETETFHPIESAALEDLISLMITALSDIGFFTQGDPREMSVFLRDIFARATLEEGEAGRLAHIFDKISALVTHGGIDP